jgi:Uncharacterized conserved protein
MIPRTIALIGTLDTKGEEFAFLRDRIENAGLRTIDDRRRGAWQAAVCCRYRRPKWRPLPTKNSLHSRRVATGVEA